MIATRMNTAEALDGKTFSRWTAVRFIGRKPHHGAIWHCVCSCGTERSVYAWALVNGKSRGCGCEGRENRTKHGGAPSKARPNPEYKTWIGAKGRCHNPRHTRYAYYGGRGITMCPEWRDDFARFLSDMGPRPTPKHSLDRYPDNDGPYAPWNCRWATRTEQSRHRPSINRKVTFNGETLCLSEWDERLGVRRGAVANRLARGWSIERALTEPLPLRYAKAARRR